MIIILALVILSMNNVRKISNDLITTINSSDEKSPIRLGKNGNNVVVIMLYRAIGEYVPYIFDEQKEMAEKYKGFTDYPNTVSFGICTNYGSPGVFGGYVYTPTEMNKRGDILLQEKHDEALKLMLVLFNKNGYHVDVIDPPFAGYKEIPDLSIYDEYSDIQAYSLVGKYSDELEKSFCNNPHDVQKHNFMMYSIFRTVPLFMKEYIYDKGKYIQEFMSFAGYSQGFIDSFSVLYSLEDITEILDDDENYFMMMQNDTPHNPVFLQAPEYQVDNNKINDYQNYSN